MGQKTLQKSIEEDNRKVAETIAKLQKTLQMFRNN
jgi:hypothetical protein